MRTIIFDSETGEPITAINLPRDHLRLLKEQGRIDVALSLPPSALRPVDVPRPTNESIMKVELSYGEGRTPDDVEFAILFTRQSALALMLPASMLAGQNDLLRKAFEEGVAHAYSILFKT